MPPFWRQVGHVYSTGENLPIAGSALLDDRFLCSAVASSGFAEPRLAGGRLVEADIERQLTLESYGYRFLRVNRFNLGADPVRTLSDRLIRLVESLTVDHNGGSIQNMQDEAEGLTTGELKRCSRCKKIKPQDAFFHKTLKRGDGGLGRVCMTCKDDTATAEAQKRQSGGQRTRSRRWRHWR